MRRLDCVWCVVNLPLFIGIGCLIVVDFLFVGGVRSQWLALGHASGVAGGALQGKCMIPLLLLLGFGWLPGV